MRNKNKTIIPIVLDCEASGLGKDSYPIEIGYVLPDGEVTSYLIKPEPEWDFWDPQAEKIHNIKRSTLFDQGMNAIDVANRLNSQLAGSTVYSDCEAYENMWLDTLFKAVKTERLFRCESIQDLFYREGPFTQYTYFYDLKKSAFTEDKGLTAHRAGDDAKAIQSAFIKIRSKVLSVINQRYRNME